MTFNDILDLLHYHAFIKSYIRDSYDFYEIIS